MNDNHPTIGGMLKTVKQMLIGFGVYMAVLEGHSLTLQSTLLNKKIESQQELNQIVSEEAKLLGLNPKIIDAKYNGETTGSRKNGDKYELHLEQDFLKTRATVRHELYHIKRGDCEGTRILTEFRYLFIAEPRAKLYATTGWRL